MLRRLADQLRHRLRRRRWTVTRTAGVRGEDLAHRLLQSEKYRVVARNYRAANGSGEIDLVAWDGEMLAMVEVKSRASEDFGLPERAITEAKLKRMKSAASEYARRAGVEWEQVRFDVVTVVGIGRPVLELYRDALKR
jgi:putative endonuclease